MKTKRTLIIAAVLVAFAALMTLGIFRGTREVQAQDQQPPPAGNRISFGMVGMTQGQSIRLNVVNTDFAREGELPPDPCRVVLTFLDADGHRLRSRDGSIIRRAMELPPGQAAFLDLNADDLQYPPGPSRLQLRAVVNVLPPPVSDRTELPPDPCVPSVEVFNNANGRTIFALSAPPSVQKLTPPPVGD